MKKKKKKGTLSLMIVSLCKPKKALRIKCRQDQNLFLGTPSAFSSTLTILYIYTARWFQFIRLITNVPFAVDLVSPKKDSSVLSLRSQNIPGDFISS